MTLRHRKQDPLADMIRSQQEEPELTIVPTSEASLNNSLELSSAALRTNREAGNLSAC